MRRAIPALLVLLLAGCTVEGPEGPMPEPSAAGAERPAPATPPAAAVPRPKEAAALAEQARNAAQTDALDAAYKYVERALDADPKNREALQLGVSIGQLHASKFPRPHSSPLFLKAAERARALRAAYPDLTETERSDVSVAFYNEACTLALQGEEERAVKSLSEAVDAGFRDLGQIDLDGELDPIRKLPAFRTLQAGLERAEAERTMKATKPYPIDFTLKDLDDRPVRLADFKGKVVILDFWGTWCLPCRKEIPHLAALYRKYHDQGVAVLGLNYEQGNAAASRGPIREFVKQNDIPYPCLIGDEATRDKVPGFEGFPTTLIVDREGQVRYQVTGYQPLGALAAALHLVRGDETSDETPETKGTSGPDAAD